MAYILPHFITREEFEKMFEHILNEENKASAKKQKRLRQYRLAMLLGFEAGMRISEIVGLKDLVSKCHDAELIIKKIERKKHRFCSVCEKDLELKECHRKAEGKWLIFPLTKEQINLEGHSINIIGGKGRKDRVVPLPKRFNNKALEMLPLKISRRSLQTFIENLGKEVLKKDISVHCVDKDTEVLAINGWKKYNEIKKGENIFTLNLKKDIIELKSIKEIFIKEYNREMYHIKNEYIDSLITLEHKLPVRYSISKQNNKKKRDIWNSNKFTLIPADELLSIKSLRQIKYKLSSIKKEGKDIGEAKAGILGWILSDGHIAKKDKDITIQQSLTANYSKCEIISKLLNESKLKFYIKIQKEKISDYSKRKSQIVVFRIAKENTTWIHKFINEDRTPNLSELLKLNKENLNAIYENMMLGDGTILRKNSREYSGQNIKRIDFIRILASLLNKRTVMGEKKHNGKIYFRTYITNINTCNIHKNIVKENYNGIVWCPSTDNKTFIARKNGTIYLTGNSLRHGFGSHLAGQGRPLHEIQMLMGHSRLDTTGAYLHANPKEAIEGAREVF